MGSVSLNSNELIVGFGDTIMNIIKAVIMVCLLLVGLTNTSTVKGLKDSIEAAINSVRDLEITDFAAEEIDLQKSIQESIARARDLEITEFAAQELDLEEEKE